MPEQSRHDPTFRWYRGDPLAKFDPTVRRYIAECRTIDGLDLDIDAGLAVWDEAIAKPHVRRPISDRWYHGDLVAENLLTTDGELIAMLDLGSVSIGDPTIDLHGAWEILDHRGRATIRTALDADDHTWLRGRAWALAIAFGTFAYYWHTMPERCADRLIMASNAIADR